MQSLWQMADDDDVVCPLPALRKVRRRRHFTRRDAARARHGQSAGPRLTQCLLPHSRCHTRATRRAALRSRAPSAGLRAALRGRLQALLGLRGSHRAEGRGYGSSVKKPFPPRVALWTPTPTPHNSSRIYAIAATAQRATAATAPQKPTAGDCEPYYFDWLKCIDKCAMPHIMQKLK